MLVYHENGGSDLLRIIEQYSTMKPEGIGSSEILAHSYALKMGAGNVGISTPNHMPSYNRRQ
jgi:hypothetical protein